MPKKTNKAIQRANKKLQQAKKKQRVIKKKVVRRAAKPRIVGGPGTSYHTPQVVAPKMVGGAATATPTVGGGMSLTGPGFNCSCNNKQALCQTECNLMNSLY